MNHYNVMAIAAILAVLLLAGCATATEFTFSNVQINSVSGTGTAELRMDVAPAAGFSGYIINLDIADPLVAQITDVTYNSTLKGMDDTTTVPFTSGHIGWVDTNEKLEAPGGQTNLLLATITFTSLAPGSTTLNTVMSMITDDNGDNMIPTSSVNSPAIDVYAVPEAAFDADTTTPLVGGTVAFTDQSTGNVASWAWTFGDGGSSADQNPTHAYVAAGTYTVTLIVTNPAGTDTETKTGYITVTTEPVPDADFTVTATNGLAPMVASFTDTSTNSPASWQWEYRIADDGPWTAFSTDQNPAGISFATAGTYDIRLTATNGGGSDTETKTHVFAAANAEEPLTLVRSGTVSGDLYIESPHTYATGVTEVTHAFTVPAEAIGNVEWAGLYVNTYSGTAAGAYGLTSTVEFNGNTLGVETMDIKSTITGASFPLNDHVTKVYSDYEAQYDVTSLITSTSPTVHVKGEPISGLTFDGRIKGITLVVAYNDGDSDTVHYWVNHGQHYVPSGSSSSTIFDASGIVSGWTSAESSIRFHSSSDAIYTFNTAAKASGTSPDTGGLLNSWDVTSELLAGTNTLGFTKSTSYSYKATLATLKARYVIPPTANFAADKTVASTTDVIQFTDESTGATAWAWDFDNDGTVDSNAENPIFTYTTEGMKTVTLTVTNEGGSDTMTKTDYINVVDSYIYFTPTPQTFMPSESRTYDIVLSSAPKGLAGYDVFVTLGTGSVADITSVSYPSWAANTLTPVLPADSIRIGGVDSGLEVDPGASNIVLATITVRGTATGSTTIGLSSLTMDADGGDSLTPTLQSGQANIGTYTGPVAAFTAAPTSGLAPLTVTFSDASTGEITTWQWDFDNDGTIDSTLQNPGHQYTTAGTYNVKLTVTGPGGSDTELKTGFIAVGVEPPVAAFTATPPSGNFPLAVTFSDESTGTISSWAWDFNNDGITDSVLQNPTKTYTTAGIYSVKLTVTGPGGSNSETKTDYITVTYPAPIAEFIGNPTSGTAPLTVAFSDQSTGTITSWAWDFDNDGTVDGTSQNPSNVFASGLHSVKLTVTGPGGTSSRTRTDYITATGLTADFTADHVSGVASRNHTFTVQFTDTSTGYPAGPDTWAWNFGNSQTSTLQNPSVEFTGRPQQFTVTLIASKGSDSDAETKVHYITITPYIEAFPGYTNPPTDLNGDGIYEDINGNGRLDYDDVVALFHSVIWIRNNTDVDPENFDFNFNGEVEYDDVVTLNDMVLYH